METTEILRTLTSPFGNSGAEGDAAKLAEELLSKYGKVHRDNLGNVICEVSPVKEDGRHLLLDAHLDQIGLIITRIDERGFLSAVPCGGIDRRGILGSAVKVISKGKEYPGVVCTIPPHLQKPGEKENPGADEIRIDVGFTKEECEKRISLGDRVMLSGHFSELEGGYVTSPALDDRAGCASLLLVLEELKGKEIPMGLSVVFSAREETGGQGAATASFSTAPTEAIAVDVSFGATPDTKPTEAGEMKKGAMIGFSPVLDMNMSKTLARLAEENDIPYQSEVMGRSTGTNADDVLRSGAGVKTALISIPLQYMHTVTEKVYVEDVNAVSKLITAYITKGERD